MSSVATSGGEPLNVVELFMDYFDSRDEAPTADEIAAIAGVSKRTMFRRIESVRDALFWDHYVRLLPETERALATPGPDPLSLVQSRLDQLLDRIEQTADLEKRRARIVGRSSALQDRLDTLSGRYRRIVADAIDEGYGNRLGSSTSIVTAVVMAAFRRASHELYSGGDPAQTHRDFAAVFHSLRSIVTEELGDGQSSRVFVVETTLDPGEILRRIEAADTEATS